MSEPTLRDVMDQFVQLHLKLQVLELEVRAASAESRARDGEMTARLQTFVDFRREYDQHTHPDAA